MNYLAASDEVLDLALRDKSTTLKSHGIKIESCSIGYPLKIVIFIQM